MWIEAIIALLVGIFAGTFTGLFPGIHINLVAAGLLALISGSYFAGVEPMVLVVFVVAMAITHTFIDFIPSIFLGAPEEDSFLAVLPGHQLLREGKGYEAIVLTLYGGLAALPIILVFSFVFVYFLPLVFNFVKAGIPYILLFVSFYLIFREEEIVRAFIVFIMAGFLGLLTFHLPVKEPLLPLLSGLFGVSGLIVSLKTKTEIPKQKIKPLGKIKIQKDVLMKSGLAAAIAAPLCSFLPGIGSGHAAVIGSEISGDLGRDKRNFLFLIGAINTIVMALSFVTAYAIGKTRTGASAAVKEILGEMTTGNLFVVMSVVLIAGVCAFFVGVKLGKVFSFGIGTLNYTKLSFAVIGLLIIVNLVLSNFFGVLVLVTASALGVFAILSGARRINLMGCLLVPTIVFYLFG
jgi:putative membrane protein